MNLRQGQFHKRHWEDYLIRALEIVIVVVFIGIGAMVAVDAFIKEDTARVAKLQKHLYEVAYGRATVAPAAPMNVRPNYGDLAEPKTRVFQDASKRGGGTP